MARILVIDDDVKMCRSINRMLLLEGHEVFEAHDGDMGMTVLADEHVDLVITDIFMPNKDGIKTIIEIRGEYPRMKIIAISGGGQVNDVDFLELADNLGAQKVLRKPFGLDELTEAVRNTLD